MNQKIDLSKLHPSDYAAPKKPVLQEISPGLYLAVEGRGKPGGDLFSESVGALYGAAFTIKMTRKFAGKEEFVVSKLEAQYLFQSGLAPQSQPMETWRWRLMIRVPEFVAQDELDQAVKSLLAKGKDERVREVRLIRLSPGRCVQMLHVGPYERETETIAKMQAFVESQGCQLSGPHHEIYISDPRRIPPERLKTILRLAVRPQANNRA